MYLAFIAVYLLTCFNYVKFYEDYIKPNTDTWSPRFGQYEDMDGNLLSNLNYCGRKSCLAKCCSDQRYLDSKNICRDELYFKDMYYNTPSLGEYNWTEVIRKIDRQRKVLNNKFAVIWRVQNSSEPINNLSSNDFYLLDFGSLVYKDLKGSLIELYELWFCVDHRFSSPNGKQQVEFVFKVPKEPQESINRREEFDNRSIIIINYKILGAGMVITFISVIWLLFRFRRVRRRYILYTFTAYLCSLTVAYALKIIDLVKIKSGMITATDCKYTSPLLYFLLLSAFCWPLALTCDLMVSIRNFRVKKETSKEGNIVTFFRFSAFAWGLPLLLTVIVLALDKSDLSLWLVEKSPFDSCFKNEKQTTLYFYVPISVLIFVNSLLFLIYSYDLWVSKNVLRNNQHCANNKFTALRSRVCRKLISALLMLIMLQFIPDVPSILSSIIYVSCAMTWSVLAFVFFFEKTVFINLYNRLTYKSKIDKFQKLEEEKEEDMLQINCEKIQTISCKDFDQGNNIEIMKSKNLGKNLTIFPVMNLTKDKKIDI